MVDAAGKGSGQQFLALPMLATLTWWIQQLLPSPEAVPLVGVQERTCSQKKHMSHPAGTVMHYRCLCSCIPLTGVHAVYVSRAAEGAAVRTPRQSEAGLGELRKQG